MKYAILLLTVLFVFTGCAQKTASYHQSREQSPAKEIISMQLLSPAFENNYNIPSKYTCDGDGVNPPLAILDIPENTQSLVLIVDDPDAPSGDWVHWTVWNISPRTAQINENSAPAGAVEGITDFGKTGWGGPCPPNGAHRYQFKLYALDTMLNLDASAKKKDIENAMQGHIVAQAMLVGLYKRR